MFQVYRNGAEREAEQYYIIFDDIVLLSLSPGPPSLAFIAAVWIAASLLAGFFASVDSSLVYLFSNADVTCIDEQAQVLQYL